MSTKLRLQCAALLAARIVLTSFAAEPLPSLPVEVVAIGEMQSVMRKGDLSARVDLRDLAKLEHLYALGPVEGLKGEITIWDGKPSIARVVNGQIQTSISHEVKACFLVYAQVRSWHEVRISPEVRDAAQLEAFIAKAAAGLKMDVSRPFPFAVRGKFQALKYHVVNKTDDEPHSLENHEKVKIHFTAGDVTARLVGFYSDRHHGVFTHHDTNVHIHVITGDGQASGHAEALQLNPGSVLGMRTNCSLSSSSSGRETCRLMGVLII